MYAWDDEAPDVDEGLVEQEPLPTDEPPAEFQGVSVESNAQEAAAIVDPAPVPDWVIVLQVLTKTDTAAIKGVDLPLNHMQ